jgi:membrane-associated phospholipid phosphatase
MKQKIREFWRSNRWLLISFFLVWLCLFVFDCMYPKIQTHLMLNGYHTPALDTFFKYVTKLGEGFASYLGIAMLLFSWRKGLFVLLGQGLTCIVTQIFKFAFAHPRPAVFFEQMGAELPETVVDVTLRRGMNSFPSGHTSAAFALFVCLALMTPRKWTPVWMILAWATAYSRIYLSQHFLEDILFGSVIGILCSCTVYIFQNSRPKLRFE